MSAEEMVQAWVHEPAFHRLSFKLLPPLDILFIFTTLIPKNVGTLCKTSLKTECYNLLILFDIYSSGKQVKQVTGDGIMIRYEKAIIKRLRCSQARIGQGSPLCETRLHKCIYITIRAWEHFIKPLLVNTLHFQMITFCFSYILHSVQTFVKSSNFQHLGQTIRTD